MQNMIILCANIQWSKVGMVLGIIAGLAILFGILIIVVTKVCHIEEDEKVTAILSHLAGANCGGCGHSGCSGFAESLACGKACIGDCKVTSKEEKEIICKIAGIEMSDEEPTVAVVRCSGGVNAVDKFDYVGYEDCINQMVIMGGDKLCSTACLGGGSCVKVCPVGAIKIDGDGVAHVDKSICISCGACIGKCPKTVIARIPAKAKVYVSCNNHCKAKEVMNACKKGCIGCGMCARSCPHGAITMVDNIPVFDYDNCTGCMTCVEKCPRKVIKVH